MNNREQLKQQLLDDPRRKSYIRGRVYWCEGQGHIEHQCVGGLELNEVLIPRNIFQKMPAKDRQYFFDERNCAINCSWFHTAHGHTKKYRDYMRVKLAKIYGESAMAKFFDCSPLKGKVAYI